jgi:hypothetical protein
MFCRQICTPFNSVQNAQFDLPDPLANWNVSNVVDSGFADKLGYFDSFYYNSTITGTTGVTGPAASVRLSSAGPDSASFFQSIQVCPNTKYTFSIEFIWTQTDHNGNVANPSVAQGCYLTMSLGSGSSTSTKTVSFGQLPNILPNTTLPSSYGLVALDSYYNVLPYEVRTLLNVTIGCNSNAFSSSGYSPTAYFDNVLLSWA